MDFVFRKEETLDLGRGNKVKLVGYVIEIEPGKAYAMTVARIPNKGNPHCMTFIDSSAAKCNKEVCRILEEYKNIYLGREK